MNMADDFERPPDGDFVIEAGWVLAFAAGTPKLLRGGHVRVRGDRIEEVSEAPIPSDARRIDAGDQLLLPGFISGHTHAASATPTRGIIETGRSFLRGAGELEGLGQRRCDVLTHRLDGVVFTIAFQWTDSGARCEIASSV